MAYEWCSAISEVATRLKEDRAHTNRRSHLTAKQWFRINCYLIHSDATYRTCICPMDLHLDDYTDLLFTALEVGFRLAGPDHSPQVLNHTSHHDQMFEAAFSSEDDEVISDAMCAWIAGARPPTGSCVRYFNRRMEEATPFSPRLRQVVTRTVGRIWPSELAASGSEIVRLLHRLDVDVDDIENRREWIGLLVEVVRSPMGFGSLSPHYWRLLDKLTSTTCGIDGFVPRDLEVMRSLEGAAEWEKLEVWMAVVWQMFVLPTSESMEGVEEVTLKLALRRPSAFQRFENLCEALIAHKPALRGICDRARQEQSPSETSLPP